jgi:methylated-DNA-[protein]-cysteine S-methyltransferase
MTTVRITAAVLHVGHLDTPIGRLTVAGGDRGVRAVLWPGERDGRVPLDDVDLVEAPHPVVDEAIGQLGEYFAGTRHEFDLPLDPVGTPFQQEVWAVLRGIPYGETISYGEQAGRLGDVRKARAVGAANGRNPISIVVPCHRVVGSTGKLTGFAAGLDVKAWLLRHEQGDREPALF